MAFYLFLPKIYIYICVCVCLYMCVDVVQRGINLKAIIIIIIVVVVVVVINAVACNLARSLAQQHCMKQWPVLYVVGNPDPKQNKWDNGQKKNQK